MQSSAAFAASDTVSPNAVLRERLALVEASLLGARQSVTFTLDRELASVRGWLQALQSFDPTLKMNEQAHQDLAQPQATSGRDFLEQPPLAGKSNIIAFKREDFSGPSFSIFEPALDPGLEKATIEELNAALDEAFRQMTESS